MRAKHTHQVALSFAGEQRAYVRRVFSELSKLGVDAFYDEDQVGALWGEDLTEHFQHVYSTAQYVVMFISADYVGKAWTKHERRTAIGRSIQEDSAYILPVRFDNAEVPGLNANAAYLEASKYSPEQLAEIICKKLVSQGYKTFPLQASPVRGTTGSPVRQGHEMTVSVFSDDGKPLEGASVLAVASNGIGIPGRSDKTGHVLLNLPVRRGVTVMVAHPQAEAALEPNHDSGTDLSFSLKNRTDGGSVLFQSGTGFIPGLNGRLNPIRDTLDRYCLYADNISADGQSQQPYQFEPGQPLMLEDATGTMAEIRVLTTIGSSSLITYRFHEGHL